MYQVPSVASRQNNAHRLESRRRIIIDKVPLRKVWLVRDVALGGDR